MSAIGGTNASKRTHTITLAPRFEYKVGSWTIEGIAGYSRSFNNYEALEQGFARSETVNNLTSDWVATRPNIQSHEWTFTQTSGNDWFNLSNFTNPRLTNEGRYARTEIYNGELSARWVAPFRRVPTVFKFGGQVGGGRSQERKRDIVLHVAIHRPGRRHDGQLGGDPDRTHV
jgi:iron complex outermembrane receptor protein